MMNEQEVLDLAEKAKEAGCGLLKKVIEDSEGEYRTDDYEDLCQGLKIIKSALKIKHAVMNKAGMLKSPVFDRTQPEK